MKGLAYWFLVPGVISVLVGMAWGIYMAATQDHLMAPAHAHLNLLGWVSFSIFAFYYHLLPEATGGRLPKLHFFFSVSGLITVVPGIALSKLAITTALATGGSILSAVGMLCFLIVVLRRA